MYRATASTPWLFSYPRRMPRKRRPGPPREGGRLPWDELFSTLDLHGETAAGARRRAERWLREHRAEGIRQVRIVTGRGLHSAGAAVLPGEIADLLASLRGTVVSRFDREPGGGAFRVELRPPEHPPAPPRPPSRPVDPARLRAAEESLRELGVEPTPALVEAELRRMERDGS